MPVYEAPPANGTGKAVWFEFNVPPAHTKSTA